MLRRLGPCRMLLRCYTESSTSTPVGVEEPFATQFRRSKFMQIGDASGFDGNGFPAIGIIVQVMEDDLYIDFGCKFNAVCKRPRRNGGDYKEGSLVRLLVRDTELSSRFLGSGKDITLLEADATLQGPYTPPKE